VSIALSVGYADVCYSVFSICVNTNCMYCHKLQLHTTDVTKQTRNASLQTFQWQVVSKFAKKLHT